MLKNTDTRGKCGILKPKIYTTSSASNQHLEPKSIKIAFNSPHWKPTINQEYATLIPNNTWSLVSHPTNNNAIGFKWVFRTKYNLDDTISKHKARLAAKSFLHP